MCIEIFFDYFYCQSYCKDYRFRKELHNTSTFMNQGFFTTMLKALNIWKLLKRDMVLRFFSFCTTYKDSFLLNYVQYLNKSTLLEKYAFVQCYLVLQRPLISTNNENLINFIVHGRYQGSIVFVKLNLAQFVQIFWKI